MLHGLAAPRFHYTDTLSKAFTEESQYDIVLANPPFKGAIDVSDVNPTLPTKVKKTEILFLYLFLRLLDNGGRGAVIVPDGVLFGSSNAHVEARKKLVDENHLDAVVSMPSGVFRPYAGVSTAILFFTKGAKTDRIWFYDMEHDGFSLDDKRQRVPETDIPDVLECWRNRKDKAFLVTREARLSKLRKTIAPLKAERLKHHEIIRRLKFEEVLAEHPMTAPTPCQKAEAKLADLQERIAPLQAEINQLGRQFWVDKEQVVGNKYDLSASRYRDVEQDDKFFEKPAITLKRLIALQERAAKAIAELQMTLERS
jgi:type I restriction enzyme M protein